MLWATNLVARDAIKGHAVGFSILVRSETDAATPLFGANETQITANLSPAARAYLTELGIADLDELPQAGLVWHHALAIGYSPRYRQRHAAALQSNWPRLPLPAAAETLAASAALGRQVAALLQADTPLPGVSTAPAKALQPFGRLDMVAPATEADLALTAAWGYGGHGKPVMPGPGRAEPRPYTPAEREALETLFAERGLDADTGYALVGTQALDIYLNPTTRWAGVPAHVWGFTIGGYQVLKKWLSYREQPILGRPLTPDEARYIAQVVRRLVALLLLSPALDASYDACIADAYFWPQPTA